jgi:hypothetical protein
MQISDLRNKYHNAVNDLAREESRRKDPVEKAAKMGQPAWDKQWDSDRFERLKTEVNTSKKAVHEADASRNVSTGKSPLASPMSNFKK